VSSPAELLALAPPRPLAKVQQEMPALERRIHGSLCQKLTVPPTRPAINDMSANAEASALLLHKGLCAFGPHRSGEGEQTVARPVVGPFPGHGHGSSSIDRGRWLPYDRWQPGAPFASGAFSGIGSRTVPVGCLLMAIVSDLGVVKPTAPPSRSQVRNREVERVAAILERSTEATIQEWHWLIQRRSW
jgi:hypothetical protein